MSTVIPLGFYCTLRLSYNLKVAKFLIVNYKASIYANSICPGLHQIAVERPLMQIRLQNYYKLIKYANNFESFLQ